MGWTLLLAVGLPALVSDRVLALYRDGWAEEVGRLSGGPVTYGWRTRFTLAAVLTEVWPRLGTVPGLRYAAAAAVLGPILWVQPRLARDPRGGLFLFALYMTAMPLVSPVSETHHLAVLAGPLVDLAARRRLAAPHAGARRRGRRAGASAAHWLGVAFAGPAAGRRGSLFDGAALLVLYAILLLRSIRATRAGPARRPDGRLR